MQIMTRVFSDVSLTLVHFKERDYLHDRRRQNSTLPGLIEMCVVAPTAALIGPLLHIDVICLLTYLFRF